MPKRPHPSDGAPHSLSGKADWSIGSGGLTQTGQSELLKHLGRQLQDNYQNILKEPPPDPLKRLLERLDGRHDHLDGEDL